MTIALALLAASTGPVALPPQISLSDRSIRASDLAVVSGGKDVIIGSLPRGIDSVEIAPEKARELLSKRLPNRAFTVRYSVAVTLNAPATKLRTRTCFAANSDIVSGAIIALADVTETPCSTDQEVAALGYDRERRAPVAKGTIIAGEYLGSVHPVSGKHIGKGERLTFRTGAGPVLIERQVEALQSGRAGGRIFARTDDGEVISAPLLPNQNSDNQEAAE